MYQVIDIKKLKTKTDIINISNHNLRATSSNNVDKHRTHLNTYYAGSPTMDLAGEMESKLATVPKYRKDAVKLVNLVLSASPEFFQDRERSREWEKTSQKWIEDTFGKENVILSVVHNDETTKHFHVSVVPIHNGKLNASHWLDGPASLAQLHTSYNNTIKHLGLSRGKSGEKPNPTALNEYYKKVNSSTEYDKKLDKKLDILLEQIEKPSIGKKLNPWGLIDKFRPVVNQAKKNLSHYKTKAESVKELKKKLEIAEKRVFDLESKIEHLGLNPNSLSYAKCTSIKDQWTAIAEKKSAPSTLLNKEGADLEKIHAFDFEKKKKIKPI
jgi:hypothetical protein